MLIKAGVGELPVLAGVKNLVLSDGLKFFGLEESGFSKAPFDKSRQNTNMSAEHVGCGTECENQYESRVCFCSVFLVPDLRVATATARGRICDIDRHDNERCLEFQPMLVPSFLMLLRSSPEHCNGMLATTTVTSRKILGKSRKVCSMIGVNPPVLPNPIFPYHYHSFFFLEPVLRLLKLSGR